MKFWKIFIAFFIFLLIPTPVLADNEFKVDANVTYKVLETGKTQVTHNITLENLFSTLYATSYSLSLENITAENVTSNHGNKITIDRNDNKTNIKLEFPDTVVGRGEKRNFFISYENPTFAVKTGEVWEITIPKIGELNNFKNYEINLEIPTSFGQKAYISPEPQSERADGNYNIYSFSKEDIAKNGVTAGFGQFQVFSYNLSYHLENPLTRTSETQIALPPDTAFQKVYIEKMEPEPENVTVDADGNWLATYKLNSRERIDVNVIGSVQIFAGYRHFLRPNEEVLTKNLAPTQYWQVDDPNIRNLALSLKTPEQIYKYVSTKLKYDYKRVTPNVQRMGAVEALKRPEEAICMEFTDLFIALSRAAGIPAREINGYAYTENKDLQPLGLVADVLHSWPEYYDKEKGVWIPIDPTWASTTNGEDFFNKLDLRHFAFVIHGISDTKPFAPGSYKLGPSPQKDVFVTFGKLSEDRQNSPQIELASTKSYTVKNAGKSALYSLRPITYFDDKFNSEAFIEVLPPYSKFTQSIDIPFSILGQKTPDVIKITLDETEALISTNKRQNIIYGLLALTFVILVIFLLILARLGKIRLNVKNIFTKTS